VQSICGRGANVAGMDDTAGPRQFCFVDWPSKRINRLRDEGVKQVKTRERGQNPTFSLFVSFRGWSCSGYANRRIRDIVGPSCQPVKVVVWKVSKATVVRIKIIFVFIMSSLIRRVRVFSVFSVLFEGQQVLLPTFDVALMFTDSMNIYCL
jgi:hypothetical protein